MGTIVIEDLNVKGMMANHKLAKTIGDCAWSEFIRKLTYKADWYGINLITIGRFEPSSKTCSVCGCINNSLTLKDREWDCTSCKTHHDRDINAAINIKNIGLNPKQQEIRVERSKLTLGESRRTKIARPTQESPAFRQG
jgi:putative transposase